MKISLVLGFVFLTIGIVFIGTSIYFGVAFAMTKGVLPSSNKTQEKIIDSKLDSDKDGLTDKVEIEIYKTNPNKKDTDGDGFDDKTEIETRHDPLK